MITRVTKDNFKLYRELFDKAEIYLNGKDAFENYDPDNGDDTYTEIKSLEEYFTKLEVLTTGQSFDGDSSDKYHIFKILPLDEPTFDIDANSRDIAVPEVFRKNGVAVQGDQLAETLFFTIDRFFETIDLYRDDIQGIIQWESAAKGKQFETGWSPIAFKDVSIVPGKMIFGWFLNDVITSNPGTVKFSVRFFSTKEEKDASNDIILKLSFSLSTKTQTITINPAISYEINEDSGLPEVNAYNDLHLVVSRFVDSEYTGEAGVAEEPEFINEEGGIYFNKSLEVKYLPDEGIHIVDLDEETKNLTLSTEAISGDAGKISYYWWEKDLAENSIARKIKSTQVYKETADKLVDGNKKYFIKVSANGVSTFEEAKGLLEGGLFEDYIVYYEALNGVVVDKTGNYWVEAKNRHGIATASAISEIIKVPGPEELVVIAPKKEGNFLNSNRFIKLNVNGTTTQKNDNIHYEWNNLTTQEHLQSYTFKNNGYNGNGETMNVGNNWSNEYNPVPESELPYFDQTIKVTVWAERNKDETEAQDFEIRVTADPFTPTVAVSKELIQAGQSNDVSISVITNLVKAGDERPIVSDEIKYQWFKFVYDAEGAANPTENDLLIEGATSPEYIVPGGPNGMSGSFYCRVTNIVNGKSASINSNLITVMRS